jgi:hypothetical protein
LDIIVQFKIKTSNTNSNNKNSSILDFYIKRIGEEHNINLITSNEYNKLKIIYEELDFPNINKKYCENVL